jgi:hypothetical protein
MQNQLRALKVLYDRSCVAMLDRLLLGCSVEGGIHMAELEVMEDGPRRITRLIVR